jgi:hypothetical protein
MGRAVFVASLVVLALATQPMRLAMAKPSCGEESGSWRILSDWVAQTGVHHTIGHIVGEALGFEGKIQGNQRAFTNARGEGHFAFACEMNDRHVVVLAHLDSNRFGTIWLTSDAGVLERSAVRGGDGARQVDNSVFRSSFDEEKQFFLAMEMAEASSISKPCLGWPSCFGATGRLAPRNPDHLG